MDAYDEATYGERIAEVYDDWYAGQGDEEAAVEALAGLARSGRALELGIGTGRIALPLAARGIDVRGIDASRAMIAKLRAKTTGAPIPVTVGDFAEVPVDGLFSLIYVVFNTFFALPSQEDQVRCFRNMADHLAREGLVVIEAFVPDPARFSQNQSLQVTQLETDRAVLRATQHDPVEQTLRGQYLVVSEQGIRLYPVQLRYAWPAELDLMARLAGLRLRERWAGWRRESFAATATQHVSIYERT